MTDEQLQVLSTFKTLSLEEAGVTLQAIAEQQCSITKQPSVAKSAGFQVGDTVRVLKKSGNVGAKYLNGEYKVTKVAKTHLWLSGPDTLQVLWPRAEDCEKVTAVVTAEV